MDAEKFIKHESHGTYSLLFPNYSLLSMHRIREIFSQFGEVRSVEAASGPRGYRFVQYKSFDEARCAVEGLRKHQAVSLLPQKPTHGKTNGGKSITASALSKRLSSERNSSTRVSLDTKSKTSSTIAEKNRRYFNISRSKTEDQPREMDAHDVVVGNIPESFGEAYLLHLFEKYDPLAISRIQVVPGSGLRYCYVYFKKYEEAIDVQRRFDRCDLSGKSLIVIHATR